MGDKTYTLTGEKEASPISDGPYFHIGLPKAGTNSLAIFIREAFGIPSYHNWMKCNEKIEQYSDELLALNRESTTMEKSPDWTKYWHAGHVYMDGWKTFTDWEMLYYRIPTSKFIFTGRDLQSFMVSLLIHITSAWVEGQGWLNIQTKQYENFHAKQTAKAAEYKAKSPDRLLVLEHNKWDVAEMEKFFGVKSNGAQIPRANTGKDRLKKIEAFLQRQGVSNDVS